ncbi:MAG: hypothetical protein RIE56_03325 [Amphiplicatus sp.]
METRVHEIADRVYRLSTYVPDVAPPDGFTFNQFLIDADEPLLFHCGHRAMFPAISTALASIISLKKLRWLSFSHFEADECGGVNQWLAAAPQTQIVHGEVGCDVSLNDFADRAPRALADGDTLDLGGRRVRLIATPHVPHGWDAIMLHEEKTGVLLCSDLVGQVGDGPALGGEDIVEAALAAESAFQSVSVTPAFAPTLNRLADLAPKTLAIMHGSSFSGDCARVLRTFAAGLEAQVNPRRL